MKDQFSLYSKKVMKYFTHPKNMGVIENADGVGTVGNPRCGDVMKVYVKVKSKTVKGKSIEYIDDIKVQTLGCGAAIASSSMMSEMVKGKSLNDALKLTNKEVATELGGLPPVKLHCSVLAEEGIRKAIDDYRKKTKN